MRPWPPLSPFAALGSRVALRCWRPAELSGGKSGGDDNWDNAQYGGFSSIFLELSPISRCAPERQGLRHHFVPAPARDGYDGDELTEWGSEPGGLDDEMTITILFFSFDDSDE